RSAPSEAESFDSAASRDPNATSAMTRDAACRARSLRASMKAVHLFKCRHDLCRSSAPYRYGFGVVLGLYFLPLSEADGSKAPSGRIGAFSKLSGILPVRLFRKVTM